MESWQDNSDNEQPSLYIEKSVVLQYDKKPLFYDFAPNIWNFSMFFCCIGFVVMLMIFGSGNILGAFITLVLIILGGIAGIYCRAYMNNVKGKKQCPSCKTLVLNEVRFCSGCGLDLIPHCSLCNAIAPHPYDRFCPGCGAELQTPSASAAIPSFSTPITPKTDDIPLAKALTAPSPLLCCPNCQTTIQINDIFCGSCGYNLEQTQIK